MIDVFSVVREATGEFTARLWTVPDVDVAIPDREPDAVGRGITEADAVCNAYDRKDAV